MLSEKGLRLRKKFGLILGCAGTFIALFSIQFIDYMKKTAEFDYIEWDMKTITADDYTIEFEIMPEFYKDYQDKVKLEWVAQSIREGRKFRSDP